ncbi:MAG: hypothetical protein IOC52_05455 [Methylobacterium sp.]|nr:hypothetical protein [Methylobacterium sp.]
MARAAQAPAGGAAKIIREVDPTFGLKDGEKIRWRVTFERIVRETAEYVVEAANKEDAEKVADRVPGRLLTFEFNEVEGYARITNIEPLHASA